MSIINVAPKRDFYSVEYLMKYVDNIIPLLPEYDPFRIDEIIAQSKFDISVKMLLSNNPTSLAEMLIKLGYIEAYRNGNLLYIMTEDGRKVKSAGGHHNYKKLLEEKEKTEIERQRLNDEKLRYEVKNAKRIYRTYWWTFGISITALILSLLKIILG